MANEYWVKNRTKNDLVSSELSLTIPVGRPVNLFKLNPALTHEMVAKSEESGFIFRYRRDLKLVVLMSAPLKPQLAKPTITESKQFMPTRRRSAIVVDTTAHSHIEELSSFDEAVAAGLDDEGFSDPIRHIGGESGEKFGEEEFGAVVVDQRKTAAKLMPGDPKNLKRSPLESGGFVMEPED